MIKKLTSSVALLTVMLGIPGLTKAQNKSERSADIFVKDSISLIKGFNTSAHVGIEGIYAKATPLQKNKYVDEVRAGFLLKSLGAAQQNVYINLAGDVDQGVTAAQFSVLGVEATRKLGESGYVSPFVGYAGQGAVIGATGGADINELFSVRGGLRTSLDFATMLYFAQGTAHVAENQTYTMGISSVDEGQSNTSRLYGEYAGDVVTGIKGVDKLNLLVTAGSYAQREKTNGSSKTSVGVTAGIMKKLDKYAVGPQFNLSSSNGFSVGVNVRMNLSKPQVHRQQKR